MKKMKRAAALLLAVLTLLALSACGDKNAEETPPPEFVYKATFKPFKLDASWFNATAVTPQGFYGYASKVIGKSEQTVDEYGNVIEPYDIYGQGLVFVGTDGKVRELPDYKQMEYTPAEGHDSYTYTACLLVQADGSFLTLEEAYENWRVPLSGDGAVVYRTSSDEEDVDEPAYSDEDYYYEDPYEYKYEQHYFVRRLNADGKELSCVELDISKLIEENENFYLNDGMGVTAEGKAVCPGCDGIYVFDVNTGAYIGKITGVDWVEKVFTMPDGSVSVTYYGETGQELASVDAEKLRLGKGSKISFDSWSAVVSGVGHDFYYTNGVNFFACDLDGEQPEKLFNWINCDVDNDEISSVTVTEDGKIVAIQSEWNEKTQSSDYTLVTVEKVPYASVPQKQVLTLATQYVDYYVKKEIIKFNRAHDDVRIELKDYSEYNSQDNWDAGLTKLTTEILAGDVPDIIDLNGLPARQMAAKGLLADLYPLVDADPELKRGDFFPNVLSALEMNGQLYETCSNFTVITGVGASRVVGTQPGWTYRELMDTLQKMDKDCTVFGVGETRYDILQYCLTLDLDHFVDWNSGKVSFDSQEFIDFLNFTKNFPADFDWEHYEWSEEDNDYNRIRSGRQLLQYYYISAFSDISYLENIYGGLNGFTFKGLPTAEGVGSMLSLGTGFGISAKCENKEAAWSFVRTFMTEDYQDANQWNFPSNLNSFNKLKQKAMTVEYWLDDSGKKIIDEETGEPMKMDKGGYWDEEKNEWVSIYSYSAEEVGKIEELVRGTSKVYDLDDSINQIIREQIEAFFAGQRSAEDTARLIQSKVSIYVNEKR
ncbi:MAG: extracellular solute-binding protein [Oscillospiraceae bacterium]|nr:extracellular solute-binding protein [Oscillospiraceae bacterium]